MQDRITAVASLAALGYVEKLKPAGVIRELIETGDAPTDIQLAVLYRKHCLPSSKAAPKTDFAWVALAAASKTDPRKDPRHYLRFVYCDGLHIVATDGHRMHIAPAEGRGPGYYNLAGDRVDETAPYLDWARVIPRREDCEALPAGPWAVEPSKDAKGGHRYAIEGRHVAKQYLDDGLKGFKAPVTLTEGNAKAPIFRIEGSGTQRIAVIMGMRR